MTLNLKKRFDLIFKIWMEGGGGQFCVYHNFVDAKEGQGQGQGHLSTCSKGVEKSCNFRPLLRPVKG